MTTLDRGFKAWAERTALGLRRELGVGSLAPLAPERLAECLGVELRTPDQIAGLSPDARKQLLEADPRGWSAVTVNRDGRGALVIYNPRNSRGRQASDIAHELAH